MGLGILINRYVPQPILEAAAPLYRRLFLSSAELRKYWLWFDKTDSWSRDALLEYQWKAMKQLLMHAEKNVPFYRETWKAKQINICDIRSPEDLIHLPILSKSDVRDHGDSLLSVDVRKKDLIVHETGGTTGSPLRIYYDQSTDIARSASMTRWEHHAGQTKRTDRQFYMARPSFALVSDRDRWGEQGERYHGDYFALRRRGYLACTNLSDDVMERYCRLMEKHRPPFLKGYASGLYILADYCVRTNRKIDFIKAVMTSSDMLSACQRKVTRQAWNCEVFDRFGLGEETATAVECKMHNGFHLDMVKCFVEIIDENGRQVMHIQGKLVGTSLTNYAMPLIRYGSGDSATLTDVRCPCGRESIMLSRLEGRTDDVVVTTTGRGVTGSVLSTMVVGLYTIREVQFIQDRKNELTLRIACLDEFANNDKHVFLGRLTKQLGVDMNIRIEYVERIPRESNGKFRVVISKIDQGI